MTMRLWRTSAVVSALVCLTAAGVSAGRPDRPSANATATAIVGSAWTVENTPVKQAHVRLRNVVSGKLQAATVADDAGRFAFENVPAGSYVVELVGGAGRTRAVGQVITIAPGETASTFLRTGAKVPWFSGFFNNGVAAVAASAATAGITAIAPITRAASPNR